MHFYVYYYNYKLDILTLEFHCSSHKVILRLQRTDCDYCRKLLRCPCYSLTKWHFDKTDLEISKGNQFEINARAKTGLKIESS